MTQPTPRPPALSSGLASRALFRSSGALACAIGRAFGGRGQDAAGRVLVVQLGDIGDLVMTSPFLRELGRASGSELDLVVKPSVLPIAELCPHADRVIAFDARRTRPAGALSGLARARRFARDRLQGGYQAAWNPRFDVDELGATFTMLWSGAAERIGYSEHVTPGKAVRNHGYDCMLTEAARPKPGDSRHEVDRLLALLERRRIPVADRSLELWLEQADRDAAAHLLASAGERLPIALGIGAGHPKRCWPPDRFARLAERLHEDHGAIAVLFGGPGESPLATSIASQSQAPVIDAVGRLSLRETAAAVAECAIYIGNDSGLMHVAAAAGLPAIEISCHPHDGDPEHPNSPERFGPHGVAGVVLQPEAPASASCSAGCEAPRAHCIEGVATAEVLAAAAPLLREAGGARS